jgi:hypothetical protein
VEASKVPKMTAQPEPLPETARTCDRCHQPFQKRFTDRRNMRVVWYWCENCDAHAHGCLDRNHPPGKCVLKKEDE